MRNCLIVFLIFSSTLIFSQTKLSLSIKRPAEIELLSYSRLIKSKTFKSGINELKANEKFESILSSNGTFTFISEPGSDLKQLKSIDSTLIYEFEVVHRKNQQNLKERTTLLKQTSGDNLVHYNEATSELTLKIILIDSKTNNVIAEKAYTSTITLKGEERDNQYDAPKVETSILEEKCVNAIMYAVLKHISDWNEQFIIELEEDAKFSELTNATAFLSKSNWKEGLGILKRYATDEGFKPKQKAKACYNYGVVLMFQGAFDEAQLYLKTAVDLFPKEDKYVNTLNQLVEEKKLAKILVDRKNKKELELKKFNIEQDLRVKREDIVFSNIEELVKITGFEELKTIFPEAPKTDESESSQFGYSEGYIEYNIVDNKKVMNGNFEISFGTPGFANNIRGNLKNGNGYLTIDFYNLEIDYSFGVLKLNYVQNTFSSLRFEKRIITNDSIYYYESDKILSFDINEKLFDGLGLIKVNRTSHGLTEIPMVRFLGYFDGENEGSDYQQREFKFIEVKKDGYSVKEYGNVIDVKITDVPSSILPTLKNSNNVNQFYTLTCDKTVFKTEIRESQDTLLVLKKIEEVKFFELENFANKYNEKISSTELASLNALVKKWVNAIADGNYELYKSLSPTAARMDLQDFTRMNSEFSKNRATMVFQNATRSIITTIHIITSSPSKYNELKNSGYSVNYVAVLYGNFKHFSEKEGISLIKENGVWKVIMIGKYGNTNNMKAMFVMSRENITPCGCVQSVLDGDQYAADKCAYYIRNSHLMNQNVEFEKCFSTGNYCEYVSQSKKLGVSFFSTNKFGTCP
jgi:hypothetical protein